MIVALGTFEPEPEEGVGALEGDGGRVAVLDLDPVKVEGVSPGIAAVVEVAAATVPGQDLLGLGQELLPGSALEAGRADERPENCVATSNGKADRS